MKSRKYSLILRLLTSIGAIAALSGCWLLDDPSDFPSGSVWRFELRYELTDKQPMHRDACRDTVYGCTCAGQWRDHDFFYIEQEVVFVGHFEVEPGVGNHHELTPIDLWAYMKVTFPDFEWTEVCILDNYGRGTGQTTGRHSVHEVFNATDVLEWFPEDNRLAEGQFTISVFPPRGHWQVRVYTYTSRYNTAPGHGSVGSRWGSGSYVLTSIPDLYGQAPLENGQWVEEQGPFYGTDSDGNTYFTWHATTTFSLQCIENCHNTDCSEPCYDGNECTDDTCVPGEGCTFESLEGTCSNNECYEEGVCQDGECVQQVEKDCDDNDPCTRDACDPLYGCTHGADNKVLRNEDPNDCWRTVCWKGSETLLPDPTERPPQGPTDDCYVEICVAGYGELSVPTDQETPPQNAPDDCLRETCSRWGTVESIPIASEPGCPCIRDWQCEDGNFCTRESCDQVNNMCINHGPDDSLIPPEIPSNCNNEVCQAGQIVLIPDDSDSPLDVDPYDCEQQYCEDGQINTAPDLDEHIGCTE